MVQLIYTSNDGDVVILPLYNISGEAANAGNDSDFAKGGAGALACRDRDVLWSCRRGWGQLAWFRPPPPAASCPRPVLVYPMAPELSYYRSASPARCCPPCRWRVCGRGRWWRRREQGNSGSGTRVLVRRVGRPVRIRTARPDPLPHL